jgi:ribosomal protein S18 acetylase RimI-like enzyme
MLAFFFAMAISLVPQLRASIQSIASRSRSRLSCRLSRIIVDPDKRAQGVGRMMVSLAVSHVFVSHHVDRIDLGVSDDNAAAINCYQGEDFAHVGTWQDAIATEVWTISVHWMTLTRAAWLARRVNSN